MMCILTFRWLTENFCLWFPINGTQGLHSILYLLIPYPLFYTPYPRYRIPCTLSRTLYPLFLASYSCRSIISYSSFLYVNLEHCDGGFWISKHWLSVFTFICIHTYVHTYTRSIPYSIIIVIEYRYYIYLHTHTQGTTLWKVTHSMNVVIERRVDITYIYLHTYLHTHSKVVEFECYTFNECRHWMCGIAYVYLFTSLLYMHRKVVEYHTFN
jgi:hypothetical protein